MYRVIQASNSYLQDDLDLEYLNWDIDEVESCKEILDCHQFTEIVEGTFESKVFDDSRLNEDGGPYVCMISFRVPEKKIRCRVEDRFEGSERLASEVDIRDKGSMYATFRSAIQWLEAHGLPSGLASQMQYDTPLS